MRKMTEREKEKLVNNIYYEKEKITEKNRHELEEWIKYTIGEIDGAETEPIKDLDKFLKTILGIHKPKQELKILTTYPYDFELPEFSGFEYFLKKIFYNSVQFGKCSKIQQMFLDYLNERNIKLEEKIKKLNEELNDRRRKKR